MVRVLGGDENRGDGSSVHAHGAEAFRQVARAQARVDQDAGAVALDERGVARAARAQDAEPQHLRRSSPQSGGRAKGNRDILRPTDCGATIPRVRRTNEEVRMILIGLLVLLTSIPPAAQAEEAVVDPGLRRFLTEFENGTSRFLNGDPTVWKQHASQRDD